MGFCHLVQAGLKPLGSSDLPASVSQSAGITIVSHLGWPDTVIFIAENIFFFSFKRSFALVAQAGVQWHDLSSLKPPSPGFKRFSYLSLTNSWNLRHVPSHLANFAFLVETGFFHVGQALVLNFQPQVIHPPRPPKVLGLQA